MKPRKKKSFLECMFADLDDISEGTDEEVKAELEDIGIDVEKAKARLERLLSLLKTAKKT